MKYHVSILDTDLYKLTTQFAVMSAFPRMKVRYEFINRDNRPFPDGFSIRLQKVIDNFRGLVLTKDQKNFVREKCYFLPPTYLDFLEGYRYDPSEVTIEQTGSVLKIAIEGFWYRTVLWETPIMECVSELYFEMTNYKTRMDRMEREKTNMKKAQGLAEIPVGYSEFGARRRFSYENQREVIGDLIKYGGGCILGTSNVHLAMEYNIPPMGTFPHEWVMAHAAVYGFSIANEKALENWSSKIYEGDLGIGLVDTYTTDVFLRAFNTKYAKLFDGVRQDSGVPIEVAAKVVDHYKKLRINPASKVCLFSDNLKSVEAIKEIHDFCKDKIIDRYGIGTWLSNDVGVKPLNIVIKLTACNIGGHWVPTVKLSDNKTKHTGDPQTVSLCKQVLNISG